MIVGKLDDRGEIGMGTCMTCHRWVNARDHICRKAMGQTRQCSANLDDLLLELRLISSLLTHILQIAGSTELE